MKKRTMQPWWLAGALILGSSQLMAVDEGTNIIGTKEAPTVLNVVPWQSKELSTDPWKSIPTHESEVLQDSLKPVDRDELQRQVDYFNLLQHSTPQAVEE